MVCGSIGYGNIDKIIKMQQFLREKGFQVINQLTDNFDYSKIDDFRGKTDLSKKIVNHDLEVVNKCNTLVVVYDGPSEGTAIEMYIAKQQGKFVILFSKRKVRSPWPVYLSDVIVSSYEDLIIVLQNAKNIYKS